MHAKPSSDWWWAELSGVIGYIPASHVCPGGATEEDTSMPDPWQDEEYFNSYGTLVSNLLCKVVKVEAASKQQNKNK